MNTMAEPAASAASPYSLQTSSRNGVFDWLYASSVCARARAQRDAEHSVLLQKNNSRDEYLKLLHRMALQRGQEDELLRPHMDGQQHQSSGSTQLKEHYAACGLNRTSVTSMSFEQLASRLTSPLTLQTVKSLLAQIESQLIKLSLQDQHSSNNMTCIGFLLKRLLPSAQATTGSGKVKGDSKKVAQTQSTDHPKVGQKLVPKKLERYPERVFLCAYMILGHPEVIFRSQGERELALVGAAGKLLPEFENLTGMILNGASSTSALPSLRPFGAQLAAFDEAWCDYLFTFVAWKVKDAKVLEEDLTRMACQLEVSMLQKCRIPHGGDVSGLSHDAKAIHTQVLEDQKLLCDKILHLTGSAGLTRMQKALQDARSKYAENLAKKHTSNFQANCMECHPDTEFTHEFTVNEMFHDPKWYLQETGKLKSSLKYSSAVNSQQMRDLHSQVRSTVENAFWDQVASRLVQAPTNYKHVIALLGDIREDLKALVPESRKGELWECMDLELITQILNSGSNDVDYLRQLLDYASRLILELGAPARDIPAKAAYESLVKELSATVSASSRKGAFFTTLVKGLRFIFEQLQVLKQDISMFSLREMAPKIGGTLGVDYLRGAFSARYQVTTAASFEELTQNLPKTVTWVTESIRGLERERMELEASLAPVQESLQSLPLPPLSSMRTGVPSRAISTRAMVTAVPSTGPEKKFCEVQWKCNEALVRLGLLQSLRSHEGANVESIAETLALNIARLHGYQNAFQQIIVIATGLLIVRQELVTQGIAGLQLQGIMEKGKQKLETLLDNPLASMLQIGTVLAEVANKKTDEAESSDSKCSPVASASPELMTRVLNKSLSPDDPVFARVSTAVGAGCRALLILGKGSEGIAAAQAALKKIGCLYLMDEVVSISNSLEVVAEATCRVHEPWYSCILEGVKSHV